MAIDERIEEVVTFLAFSTGELCEADGTRNCNERRTRPYVSYTVLHAILLGSFSFARVHVA